MIKTFEDRLKHLVERTTTATEIIEKASILHGFDDLLINVFTLVNESIAKNRALDFVDQLQSLELHIAEEREAAYLRLFTS